MSVALSDKSNKGLSDKLNLAFPDFVPVNRSLIKDGAGR